MKAASGWLMESDKIPDKCPLPVAIGYAAGKKEMNLQACLTAFLHSLTSNQVQAALRLFSLGQKNGLTVLIDLEELIVKRAEKASFTCLDDLGSSTLMNDIMSMEHNLLDSRIFRS